MRPIVDKIFFNEPAKKFIDTEKLICGFFHLFVMKDFVLRELIHQFTNIRE